MNKKIAIALLGFYAISRLFIWVFRPLAFTEIIYSYMPYAHLWESGETPYLRHWYEYPPATIPLFYLPHVVDKATLGTPIHLSYLQAYRLFLLLIDVAVFTIIWQTLKKYQKNVKLQIISLLYYILVTAKAHHFIYDTMDLSFTAAITIGLASSLLLENRYLVRFFSWLGYFLAVGLKYVNAPLAAIYALLEFDLNKLRLSRTKTLRDNLFAVWQTIQTGIKPAIIAFLALVVVWGFPLIYFRSSLQVSLIYHQGRGLQIDSALGSTVRLINEFTQSEKIVEQFKNYDIVGPVSSRFLAASEIIFPLSIIIFLIYGVWLIFRYRTLKGNKKSWLAVYLTILYFLIFMLSGKVLSTPFMLWLLPLFALYPFRSLEEQLTFLAPSALIVLMSMTGWPNSYLLNFIHLHVILVNVRWILFAIMLFNWLKLGSQFDKNLKS